MDKKQWQIELEPILRKKIEEAINEADSNLGQNDSFPWIGDFCYQIMADAAISVLRGMQDAENFMLDERML